MQVSMNAPYQVTSAIYVNPSNKDESEDVAVKNGTKSDEEKNSQKSQEKKQNPNELNDDEKRVVTELQARDTEVRAHEAAHQAAGGGMTGGASYTYQKGPDGQMYAIGGEVSISMKGGATPQETIANARQVQAAAMAPANPSGQDYAVATSAKVMEMKAQQELTKEQQEKMSGQKEYGSLQSEDEQTQKTDPSSDYKPFDVSA